MGSLLWTMNRRNDTNIQVLLKNFSVTSFLSGFQLYTFNMKIGRATIKPIRQQTILSLL
jgi:hypothetical protein